ncbi:MAG TPA: hypothetical protein VMB05_18205 [Solirubrobacteraceae bacterium]|nr:hypothetical protein [Solirubrobacteraceae bacterium]
MLWNVIFALGSVGATGLLTLLVIALMLIASICVAMLVIAFAPAAGIGVAVAICVFGARGAMTASRLLSGSKRNRRQVLAMLGGLGAVLVPTLFTVFPHWSNWSVPAKLLVVGAWALAALLVVLGSVRMGVFLEHLDSAQRRRLLQGRERAEEVLIAALLAPGNTGLGSGYAAQVFLPSSSGRRMMPHYDPDGWGPEEGWVVGREPRSVTAEAWDTNLYSQVRGSEVADGTRGLTKSQQERYKTLTGVAATPIQDARGRQIGVLAFLAETADASLIGQRDFIRKHIALAEVLAHVLVNVGGIVVATD